jgi:hypothetical protein
MLIVCEFPTMNGNKTRIIFLITDRVRNEVQYEMSSIFAKNIFYVEDLLTGDRRALYLADLHALMNTDKEYIQFNKHHYYKL